MKGIDIAHRAMTLSLLGVTMAGAYFTANGSYSIVSRRIASPPPPTPPPAVMESKKV